MEHLTRSEQYSLVYTHGDSWHSDLVVLRAMPNSLSLSRCGFSVSKKVGKAVVRNKVKRMLREIIRLVPIKPGWDIIIIARSNSATAQFSDLKKEVENLLSRARIVGNVNPVV